ncbi:MAG: PaaI family thioesterase [Myxococcota bacterium]
MTSAQDHAEAYLARDELAQSLGIELLEVGEGTARGRLPAASQQRNGVGSTHGALIFALADIVLAAACNAYEDPSIGMQVNIAYIERPAEGDLFADVEEVSRGGRIAHYTVAVTDARGVEVSRATAITYIKRARG